MKRAPRHPVLITDAPRSPTEERHSRQVRYAAMMGVRALCLVAAAVLVATDAPLLVVWIPLCLFGMVILPWLAVIIANDGPPRPRQRRGRVTPPARPAVAPTPGPRVIDADPGP